MHKLGAQITETVHNDPQRIPLSIDYKVIKTLKSEKIDINQLFILLAMYDNNTFLLDLYDDNNADQEVMIMQYQPLYIHGFIEDSEGAELYQLSTKGKEFVENVKPLLEIEEEEQTKAQNFKKLCKDYLEIFPKIKLPSGKYARTNIVEIEKKMKTFLSVYKKRFKADYGTELTDAEILQATKAYVDRFAKDGYKFMVTSSYFIQKNEKSALADELYAGRDGLNKIKTNITTM